MKVCAIGRQLRPYESTRSNYCGGQQLNPKSIASRFTDYYGLSLVGASGREADGHEYIEFLPAGVHRNEAFSVKLTLGWRSLRGDFIAGSFAAPMIQEIGRATEEEKSVFAGLIRRMKEENAVFEMLVNDTPVDPTVPSTWPDEWKRLTLSFEKTPLAVNTEDSADTENALLSWGGRFLAAILSLTPLEEIETEEDANPEGLPEGAKTSVEVNKYERNRFNRAACIEIHGGCCKACGFDFQDVYGELGEGFIHVHHITPVSDMGANYQVDPVNDLVPLCPNCHAMMHRRSPPMSISELKVLIDTNRT